MTKIAPWPHPWPPIYDEAFTDPHDGKVTYSHIRAIWKWLQQSPACQHWTSHEMNEYGRAIELFDITASLAGERLKACPWSTEQLRNSTPPDRLSDRELKRWKRLQSSQHCIDRCEKARNAVYTGNFSAALRAALAAGFHFQGDAAQVAQQILKVPHRARTRVPRHAERDRQYRAEAAQIRAKSKRHRSDQEIAQILQARHANEPNCPSADRIRHIIDS